jgi:hypothetical protein
MRPIFAFRMLGASAVACLLALGGASTLTGCFDEDPAPPARTGGSTVVVTKPGVTAPQPTVVQQAPAPQSSPPIINNVVQPAAPAPTVETAPAAGTTVNVQPRTVTVP